MAGSALIRCLDDALLYKRITKKRADEIKKLLDEAGKRADPSEMAQVDARLGAIHARLTEVEWAKRSAALQVAANKRVLAEVRSHPEGAGPGAMSHFVSDTTERAQWSNVERRGNAHYRYFRSKLAEGMSALRTRNLGLTSDTELLEDVVRAQYLAHGLPAGPVRRAEAAPIGKAWSETTQEAVGMFNRAGGNIIQKEDWLFPQIHEARKLRKVSVDEYVRDVVPMLDADRMFSKSGAKGIDPATLPKIAEAAYRSILSGEVGADGFPSAVKNRHRQHRVLAFKDAESFLAYQKKYGTDDLYGLMTGHLNKLADEIGAMEVLGPNPEVGYRLARQEAAKWAGPEHRGYISQMDAVWDAVTGKINSPGSVRVAQVQGALQDTLISAQLGGAFLSSITDQATTHVTLAYNGLSSVRYMRELFEQLRPGKGGEEARIFAARLGVAHDAWARAGIGASRFMEDILATRKTKVLSEVVMRASLLSHWTDSGRAAFGVEFLGTLADMTRNSLDEIGTANPRLGKALRRYGWTAREWDALRSVPTVGHSGANYVSIDSVRASNLTPEMKRSLSTKLLEMIDTESDFAVPVPDARVRGHLMWRTKPGTLSGSIMRAVAMYKSFPMTMVYRHWLRAWNQQSWTGTAAYAIGASTALTAMGALAYQAKAVARGKEPMEWDDPRLWRAAYFQGGGAGIFGDFMQGAMTDRFGHGPLTTAMGPVFGFAEDTIKATAGNFGALTEGRDPNVVDDWARFAGRYTPGSSLWYTRAAWDRMFVDQLRLMADPQRARRSFTATERFQKERTGTGFWWRPGQVTPGR